MAPAVADALALAVSALTPVAPPDAAALGYGTDLRCIDDLDPNAAMVDPLSPEGIGQDLYHRLDTPRDATVIREDDGSYGLDVVGLLSKGLTQQSRARLETAIAAECMKDDRVLSADVTLVSEQFGKQLRIRIVVTPVDPRIGNFALVLIATSTQVLLDAISKAAAGPA
jgi:hypothetical protein